MSDDEDIESGDDSDDDDGGLPVGWSIELDPGARRADDGRVLIGGSPFRVLRLTAAGARWLDDAAAGRPLAPRGASRRFARRLVDAGLANPQPRGAPGLSWRDIALVIPVRDAADGLARTLAAVGEVGEIVVVDDGSAEPDAVEQAAIGATVLRHVRSLGPGAARERGWRATSRPVIAFVDADVVVEGDWLAPLLAHLDDPAVGAAAPRVVAAPGADRRSFARYDVVRSSLDLGPLAGRVQPGGRVPYVPTAALVVRRTAIESVDGFDAGLRVGEDVDLVWRLHEQGWTVRYEPASVVRHPSRPALGAWVRQRVTYGSSAAALAERHGAAVAPLRISGWSALVWGAVLFGRPGVALVIGAGTTAALAPKLSGLQHPAAEAMRIAGLGNLRAGRYVADAVRRPWWPVAIVLAGCVRRVRPALLAAVVVPSLLDFKALRPRLGPLRFGALRLLDDVAYGTGVWVGCIRRRSVAALLPTFSGPVPRPEPFDRLDR